MTSDLQTSRNETMNGLYGNRILLFRAFLRARLLFPREKHVSVYFSQCSIALLYAISLVSNEKKEKKTIEIELNWILKVKGEEEIEKIFELENWKYTLEIIFSSFFFFYDKFCDTSYFLIYLKWVYKNFVR